MNRERQLASIARQILACSKCRPRNFKGKAVPGEGPADAHVIFVGEAPGKQENIAGRPFVGRSGKFLDELFKHFKISRKRVFITSIAKYYPGPRKPSAKEIEACRPFLKKQLEIIKPKLVVLLGDIALKWFFPKLKLKEAHGKKLGWKGMDVIPTFHPAAGMRFPKIREKMLRDFKKIQKEAKRYT